MGLSGASTSFDSKIKIITQQRQALLLNPCPKSFRRAMVPAQKRLLIKSFNSQII
jgi:hypothetical protein